MYTSYDDSKLMEQTFRGDNMHEDNFCTENQSRNSLIQSKMQRSLVTS